MLPLALLLLSIATQSGSPKEIRGVWISPAGNEVFSSPAKLVEAMDFLLDAGANVVFVPAWAEGTASYPSGALREASGQEPPRRDLLEETVFAAHRAGLEVVPWVDPGFRCPSGAEDPLLQEHPELFVRDAAGKVAVEDGVAKLNLVEPAGRDLLRAVVLEICRNYDVDGILGTEVVAGLQKVIAAVDPALVVPASPALDPPGAPDPDQGGDRVYSYPRLREKNGELAEALRNGAWAEPALLPWRSGRVWRRRTDPVDPAAGQGTWSWAQKEGEPQSLVLEGGQHGHATWTYAPKDAGVYTLYAWVPSRTDQTSRASYRMTALKGARDIVIDPNRPENQGWIRLGNVVLEAGKEAELARLLAEEDDATKVTVAGALLPLLNRRAMRR